MPYRQPFPSLIMTLLLQPITPSPTRRFTHQATSTDPGVSTVLLLWDPELVSFVAELYETTITLEREAAFLILGDDPLRPIHSIEALEDQLGDRIQPLSAAVYEYLTSEVLADLYSRLNWQFVPGNRLTFSTVTHLSLKALNICRLNAFTPDEWGRLRQELPCLQGYRRDCFEEESEAPFAVCPLTQQSFTPTQQQHFVISQ